MEGQNKAQVLAGPWTGEENAMLYTIQNDRFTQRERFGGGSFGPFATGAAAGNTSGQGDARYWTAARPVLFPIVGRLQ